MGAALWIYALIGAAVLGWLLGNKLEGPWWVNVGIVPLLGVFWPWVLLFVAFERIERIVFVPADEDDLP